MNTSGKNKNNYDIKYYKYKFLLHVLYIRKSPQIDHLRALLFSGFLKVIGEFSRLG